MEKPNDQKEKSLIEKMFSSNGVLIFIAVLIVYWVFFKDSTPKSPELSVSPSSSSAVESNSRPIVGVSNVLNEEAIQRLGVDLTENLNPQLVPALVAEAMKETAQSGVSESAFTQAFVTTVSNKIKDISTIDLDNNGFADPILVIPQNYSEAAEQLQLSIRVPDPVTVTSLPEPSDQGAWSDIAENRSIEIMNVSAIKEGAEQLAMQAAPNPEMYQNTQPYYRSPGMSFSDVLLTSLMVNWLMGPRFYGPGFGYYGGANPRTVQTVQRTRVSSTSGLRSAQGTSTPLKTNSGRTVANNNFKTTSANSLRKIKTSQYQARNTQKAVRSGGFGSTSASQNRPTTTRPTATKPRPSTQRSFGFPKKSRGFGGFRKKR